MNSTPLLISTLVIALSAVGVTFLFRTFTENLISGLIVRVAKGVRPGTRVKILAQPQVLKGDVVRVGPLRTTLLEVGDGEHLPSMLTGRLIKVPNTMLVGNAIMIYGDTIVDEVIAEVRLDGPQVDDAIAAMRQAIEEHKHKTKEVRIYQRGDRLVVHGVFEVQTSSTADERGKVLKSFLARLPKNAFVAVPAGANGTHSS
ncbi:MAG: mechanosensitive ion channel family protein [Dehalococcoidia bacterium]|nr:mechanosensitive ion channel family protein [Dehalococcoidia bacterium]